MTKPNVEERYADDIAEIRGLLQSLAQRGMMMPNEIILDAMLQSLVEMVCGEEEALWDHLYRAYHDRLRLLAADAEEQLAAKQSSRLLLPDDSAAQEAAQRILRGE